MGKENRKIGVELRMGWLPDYPDFRDLKIDTKDVNPQMVKLGQTDSIQTMLGKIGVADPAKLTLPNSKDLREWCPPIEDQGSIGSCTANAGVGIIEYYERKAHNRHIDASRLFLYKATRNLLHWQGDRGAFLRTTMAAMVLFGVPPEEYWPYVEADFDEEPSSFCYSFAQNYQAIQYYRLDPPSIDKNLLLTRIKGFIAAGLPSMFGFVVFSSINQAGDDGLIPYPCRGERVLGGHAVVAVGYDDRKRITNPICNKKTNGALLIRNSWSTDWGDNGYGWLPYDYVTDGMAVDWWSLLRKEWVDSKKFGL